MIELDRLLHDLTNYIGNSIFYLYESSHVSSPQEG